MQAEERYEIREKIGQGGVGAVYRAFDSHLNREIAIKRVLAGGGYENQEGATKAMLQEASSLCSVQHPNIVTVFDAGVDDDGPFVVMELLSGRTIDEMVERGTLTYEDFRELALQTQEALIAAQDLDLVHRDIKPTNIMVTWLPSGRFQVKLVDFGLAKFSPHPTRQTIDHGDAVFGSIHFMAPEQFERKELDKRTDLYSLGCVYYFCLAGVYPFDGETAPQVMSAHLNHTITPIGELRPDLPEWLCDWVMWHLKRKMDARPTDTRESLSKFLMSENPNTPTPGSPEKPARPKLIIPGAQPAPVTPPEETPAAPAAPATPATPAVPTQTAPQPILPPAGARPSVHTLAQQLKAPAPAPEPPAEPAVPVETPAAATTPAPQMKLNIPAAAAPPVEPAPVAEPVPPAPAPAPAAPTPPVAPVAAPVQPAQPAPAAPVLVTPAAPASPPVPAATSPVESSSEQVTVHLQGAPPPKTAPLAGATPAPDPLGRPIPAAAPGAAPGAAPAVALPQAKGGLSAPVKAVIAAALAIGLIIASLVFLSKSKDNDRIETLNRMTAGVEEAEEVSMNRKELGILLNELNTKGKKEDGERPAYQTALWKGVARDGTDIDQMIAEFATGEATAGNPTARQKLFEVLARRKGESAIPALVEFAGKTEKSGQGKQALQTAGLMASASNFSELLKAVSLADESAVKNQAVTVLSKVVKDSEEPSSFGGAIVSAYKSAVDSDTKKSLLRLLGASGGNEAGEIVAAEVEKDDKTVKLAAIAAMRQWPDGSMFETLHGVADAQEDNLLRKESFQALVKFLSEVEGLEEEDVEMYWTDVATIAVSETEQMQVVQAMANQKSLWAEAVLDYFIEDADANATDRVIDRSERAKRALQARMRRLGEDE